MAGGDKVGHLLNDSATSSLVRLGDDEREVLRAKVRRCSGLDTLETFFEPLGGLCEIWLESRASVSEIYISKAKTIEVVFTYLYSRWWM